MIFKPRTTKDWMYIKSGKTNALKENNYEIKR